MVDVEFIPRTQLPPSQPGYLLLLAARRGGAADCERADACPCHARQSGAVGASRPEADKTHSAPWSSAARTRCTAGARGGRRRRRPDALCRETRTGTPAWCRAIVAPAG